MYKLLFFQDYGEVNHYFFFSSFLSRFLKGQGSLRGSGGIINLGSAQRYFFESSVLFPPAPFGPFIQLQLLMKKQSIYLPTLNSLFIQHKNYSRHRHNVHNSKSALDQYSKQLKIENSRFEHEQKQVVLLRNQQQQSASHRKIKQTQLIRYRSCEKEERQKELTPYEKRKLSERDNENNRIYRVLQCSNRSQYGRNKKQEQLQQALRSRISKYIREGNSVKYKFKKSLADIERRKKEKDQLTTLNSIVIDQARQIIESLNNKHHHIKLKTSPAKDIYLQTIHSQGKMLTKKLFKSQELLNHAMNLKAQSEYVSMSNKNDSEERSKSSYRQRVNTDSMLQKDGHLSNKNNLIQYLQRLRMKKKDKLQYQQINQSIGLNCLLLKQRKKQLHDLEIISVTPAKDTRPVQKSTPDH